MPNGQNDQLYEFDNRSVLKALKEVEKVFADSQKTGKVTGDVWEHVFTTLRASTQQVTTVIDKQTQAQTRLVKSILAQNDAYGKSAIDKEIQKRDRVIKQLGDNKKAVDQVRASYDSLLKKMQEEAKASGGHGNGPLSGAGRFAFLGAKDLLEGRSTNAFAEGANVLTRIGGSAAVAGGLAAGIVATGAAAFEARKHLAEYGVTVRDVQLQTGISAKEFGALSFSAQAVGKDVTIVDRLMRGLSQATEEMGPAGDKARKTLADIGVSVIDINGKVRPTSELLLSISDAMQHLAPGTKLSADAIEIFKRAGVDAIPFLKELRENSDYFAAHGLPSPTQSDIDRFSGYNRQIAEMDAKLGDLKRTALDIFQTFIFSDAGTGLSSNANTFGSSIAMTLGISAANRELARQREQNLRLDENGRQARDIVSIAAAGGQPALLAAGRRANDFIGSLGDSQVEQARARESQLKSDLDEKITSLRRLGSSTGGVLPSIEQSQEREVTKANDAYQRQVVLVRDLVKADSDRVANAEALRKALQETADNMADGLRRPVELRAGVKGETVDIGGMLKTDRRVFEISRMSGMLSEGVLTLPSPDLQKIAQATRPEAERELKERNDELIRRVRESNIKVYEQAYAGRSETLTDTSGGIFQKLDDKDFNEHMARESRLDQARKESVKVYGDALRENRRLELESSESSIHFRSAGAQDTLANRLSSRAQLASVEIAGINDTTQQKREDAESKFYQDALTRTAALRAVELEGVREVAKVRSELATDYAHELRAQIDDIKKDTSSLLETLFTSPSKFGSQLGSTLRSAVLHPIIDSLSEQISTTIRPVVFGASGTGGIAGGLRSLFGGSTANNPGAPLMPAASALTYAASALTSAASAISMSSGGSSLGSSGGSSGFSSLPFSGGASGGFGGGLLGPGGTAGFNPGALFNGASSGTSSGGGSGFNLSGLLGGGTNSRGGILSSLRGMGSMFGSSTWSGISNNLSNTGNSLRMLFGGNGMQQGSTLSALSTGPAANTPIGGLVTSGGIALAMHGLLGEARGTASGIAQGAAGGFLIAGPIGAAIGAALGIGEMLAGVESPRREAKRLVRQQYHIDINNQAADQIVALARQSYAGRVSLAVRSPEVRQMLGLYAAGTGQASSFPQSSMTPHGGGLVASGGMLYQAAQYQYGNAYTYSSSLPTYGGGSSFGLPTPGAGGPLALSVNIEGKGVDQFMTGNVVTPSYIASSASTAYRRSDGRVELALALRDPGAIRG